MRSANTAVGRPGFATWPGWLLRAVLGPLVLAHSALFGWYAFAEPAGRPALPATNQPSPIELFKAFVANPPPIADLQLSFVGNPPELRTRDGRTLHAPAPTNYVRAKWQPGSLIMLQAPARDGLKVMPLSEGFVLSNKTVLIQSDDEWWWVDGRVSSVTSWRGQPQYPLDTSNPVLLHYAIDTLPLFSFFGMGAHMIPPGGITWRGNTFEYTARAMDSVFRIRGEVLPGRKGLPEEMRLSYTGSAAIGRYTIHYHFAVDPAGRPSYIPDRILSLLQRGGREVPDKDIRVLSAALAPAAAAPAEFRPDGWLAKSHLSRLVFNGQLFMEAPDGQLVLVRRPRFSPPSLAHQIRISRYYYVCCVLSVLAFLFLVVRMRAIEAEQTSNAK